MPKVREEAIMIEQKPQGSEKIFDIDQKKSDPNNDGQQFFVPNNDAFTKIGI